MEDSTVNRKVHTPIPPFNQLHLDIHPFNPIKNPVIYNNILETIGNTPMVKLNRIPKLYGIKCEIVVKCEYLNPSGSLKDRIAKRMIEAAERDSKIEPGYEIIEPSSGNTGIGLSMVAAVKGYNCTIVMTKKMSKEKERTIGSLGGQVVRGEIGKLYGEDGNTQMMARELHKANSQSVIPDQYNNPYNPLVHYETTAEEILWDCQGQLDMVVAGAGTGGTLTGISRKIKEKLPDCKIIGVDAEGSILGDECCVDNFGYFDVEGIGHDYKPYVLNYDKVDKWCSVSDKQSFQMARDLIRFEGLLVGGSSGSTVWAAIQACKEYDLQENNRCVVILADSIRNYLTKFLDDDWMESKNLL